jgi:hypothetical protein
VTVRETPTFSRSNFAAQAAASAQPPMLVSAITHCTGEPSGYFSLAEISLAALLAMFMVCSSSDSRTPLRRPSITGRMPTLGKPFLLQIVLSIPTSSFK